MTPLGKLSPTGFDGFFVVGRPKEKHRPPSPARRPGHPRLYPPLLSPPLTPPPPPKHANKKVRVAIIGLGFGAEFIPIYQNHPAGRDVRHLPALEGKAQPVGRRVRRGRSLYEARRGAGRPEGRRRTHQHADPRPRPQSLAALKAGKHVACTVPMATTVDECEAIVEAQRATGKIYMMMETVVYSREFLFVKQLYERGELGRLQFLRGSHLQEMAGWPGYWEGLPPMHYATHCVSPCLCLPGKLAESVVCHGSGRISEQADVEIRLAVRRRNGHVQDARLGAVRRSDPQPVRNGPAVHRKLRRLRRQKVSFEWPRVEHEPCVLHRGEKPERVEVPDFAELLPEGIRRFTTKGVYDAKETQHLSFLQGSGHGGSHPHLAHEFISAIVAEARSPLPDAATSANWTMTGICAHISAMKGGERIHIPRF